MHPILKELKEKINNDASILKINIDKNARMASKYQIQSVPTLLLFKNGNIVWRQSGVVPTNQLMQIIKKFS